MCDVAGLQPDITYAEYLASSRQQDARDRARFVGAGAAATQAQLQTLIEQLDERFGLTRAWETVRAWQQLAVWADSLKGNQ